jgi:hypothetical protein
MFVGSLDKDSCIAVERILSTVNKVKYPNIYVGCSGNFTFDRIASFYGFNVYSNDVSLYSRLVAAIVQKESFSVKCVNDELLAVFDTWSETPYTMLVKVMFTMQYGQFARRKNEYQAVMCDTYKKESKQFFDKTIDSFQKSKCFDFNIADFFFGDFKAHLNNANENSTVFLYAPTYKGGYEKLYNYVERSFEYERPSYELFDSGNAGSYYRELLESKRACVFSDMLYPETKPFITGRVDKEAGKRSVYFYTNITDDTFYLRPQIKTLDKTPEILSINDIITDETDIRVVQIPTKLVNHYKHLFMSVRVDYNCGGDFAIGFLADKKLFGFATFSKSLGTQDVFELMCLLSDFVVPSSVDRLSKLLLYLLRSADVSKLLRRHYAFDYKGLQTSVYTDKPVSMKYRGIFQKQGSNENNKLVYTAKFTNLSIKECYKKWKNRKNLDQ